MENSGGKFVNKTGEVGDASISGWMNSILPMDIDNDGDIDYVVGNKGNNSFIQAKVGSPSKVFWADFDGNGRQDIAMSYQYGGADYPLFTMDEMGKAYPFFINKKFTTYNDFAGKTMEEIFGADVLKQNSLTANMFSSFIAVNNGGKFSFTEMPMTLMATDTKTFYVLVTIITLGFRMAETTPNRVLFCSTMAALLGINQALEMAFITKMMENP